MSKPDMMLLRLCGRIKAEVEELGEGGWGMDIKLGQKLEIYSVISK